MFWVSTSDLSFAGFEVLRFVTVAEYDIWHFEKDLLTLSFLFRLIFNLFGSMACGSPERHSMVQLSRTSYLVNFFKKICKEKINQWSVPEFKRSHCQSKSILKVCAASIIQLTSELIKDYLMSLWRTKVCKAHR